MGMSGQDLQLHQSVICSVQIRACSLLRELGRMDAWLDMLRDLHNRTMMCYPNSERMYESVLDLSDALEITDRVIENKKLLESFLVSAVKKFGEKHLLIFKLRYNHAHAIYMRMAHPCHE